MSRLKQKRIRLGSLEKKLCKTVKRRIKKMPLWTSQAATHENALNRKLKRYLEQTIPQLVLIDRRIRRIEFAGEDYRPEYFFQRIGAAYPLLAFECKKMTQHSHKRNFKEALSQALLYSSLYKQVFLVLYDFSRKRIYSSAFGRGNKHENGFARLLRDTHNIEIVSISAKQL